MKKKKSFLSPKNKNKRKRNVTLNIDLNVSASEDEQFQFPHLNRHGRLPSNNASSTVPSKFYRETISVCLDQIRDLPSLFLCLDRFVDFSSLLQCL